MALQRLLEPYFYLLIFSFATPKTIHDHSLGQSWLPGIQVEISRPRPPPWTPPPRLKSLLYTNQFRQGHFPFTRSGFHGQYGCNPPSVTFFKSSPNTGLLSCLVQYPLPAVAMCTICHACFFNFDHAFLKRPPPLITIRKVASSDVSAF